MGLGLGLGALSFLLSLSLPLSLSLSRSLSLSHTHTHGRTMVVREGAAARQDLLPGQILHLHPPSFVSQSAVCQHFACIFVSIRQHLTNSSSLCRQLFFVTKTHPTTKNSPFGWGFERFQLSIEFGTFKTVRDRLRPWLSGKSPFNLSRCSFFSWKRS